MLKGRSLFLGAGISVAMVVLFMCIMGTLEVGALSKAPEQSPSYQLRPDIITFDLPNDAFKTVFLHDRHTDALQKKNKDCSTCHMDDDGRISLKFKRVKEVSPDELTTFYCDNCTKCHADMIAAGEKAGPTNCDEFRKEQPLVKSSRMPFGFDKSLHYRHIKVQKKKCERCHHDYDQEKKQLVYAKNKESTCRYCHQKEVQKPATEKQILMRSAFHMACVDCHLKTLAKNMIAGPITCRGCHDLEEQNKIEKTDKVPRLKRKQPDIVLIKTGEGKKSETTMYRVPFGHKAHERYNDTCRVCHHADLKSCDGCHTLAGAEDGNYVKLKEAMHMLETKKSCMGCHAANLNNKACTGCHAFIDKNRKPDSASCMKCHLAPPKKSTGVLYQSGERRLARMIPEIWQAIFGGARQELNIPKKVIINALENQYEPVELEHLKIINALKKNINDSSLASYFHPSEASLCQGCHHNSPGAVTPPKCGSCHGEPFNEKNLAMPGLKGAYHRQCMGCHDQMGMAKPDKLACASCHLEKKQQVKEVSPDDSAPQTEKKPAKTQG
jgi:hypothetical protein